MKSLNEEEVATLFEKIEDENITNIMVLEDLVDTEDRRIIKKAVYDGTLLAKEAIAYNRLLNEEDCRHLIKYLVKQSIARDLLIQKRACPSDVLKQLAITEHNLLTLIFIRDHQNCDEETRVILTLRGVTRQTEYSNVSSLVL